MMGALTLLFVTVLVWLWPGPNAAVVSLPTLLIVAVAFVADALIRWVRSGMETTRWP